MKADGRRRERRGSRGLRVRCVPAGVAAAACGGGWLGGVRLGFGVGGPAGPATQTFFFIFSSFIISEKNRGLCIIK